MVADSKKCSCLGSRRLRRFDLRRRLSRPRTAGLCLYPFLLIFLLISLIVFLIRVFRWFSVHCLSSPRATDSRANAVDARASSGQPVPWTRPCQRVLRGRLRAGVPLAFSKSLFFYLLNPCFETLFFPRYLAAKLEYPCYFPCPPRR